MTHAFFDLLHKSMSFFIDDFNTQTSKIDHMVMLRACFDRCHRFGIALNPEKIYLAMERGVLLGHTVSQKGKEPNPEKIEVIINLQPPSDVKGVQRVLGHFGWYRDIMHDYATATIPLTNLTKKGTPYNWTLQWHEGFNALKAKLTTYPCLLPPNWDLPFHVYYDASKVAIGSVLCQPIGENHKVHPIAFASRQLTATERNYSTTERECLAMVFIVKKFRHYLLLNPVVFFIDHMALKYLVNKLDLSGRLACWILLLEEFDYIVEYKPCPMHKQANFVIVRIHCEQNGEKGWFSLSSLGPSLLH